MYFHRSNKHNVYMGVNARSVRKANPGSAEFQGTFLNGENVFPIDSTMVSSKPRGPFFWRVDAINEVGNVIKGNLWKFRIKK